MKHLTKPRACAIEVRALPGAPFCACGDETVRIYTSTDSDGQENERLGVGMQLDTPRTRKRKSDPSHITMAEETPSSPASTKRSYMSRDAASSLLSQCDDVIKEASKDLNDARELAKRAGLLWSDSSILDPTFPDASKNLAVLRTTGGHSNTDHVVRITGDARIDRIAELKRAMQRRARAIQPENKGEDRWDKPRIPGERRRRILREKDMPGAPPEPPPSGYSIFIYQMTTKIRHDRPNEPHNQVKGKRCASGFLLHENQCYTHISTAEFIFAVVKEISKVWKFGISEKDRQYYNDFAREAREEYQAQHREFRATGQYTPSKSFLKLEGGPWVRVASHEKTSLEREIDSYESVQFPPRPPEMDEAYRKREKESYRRRREKEKAMREQQGEGQRDEEVVQPNVTAV